MKNLLFWRRLTAFPHYGNRSFTFVQDDALWFFSPWVRILRWRSEWRLAIRRHSALLADGSQLTANSSQLTANSSQLIAFIFLPFPSLWCLTVRRHSERRQACLVGKTKNGTVTQSEESITLMRVYQFPHYGSEESVIRMIWKNVEIKKKCFLSCCQCSWHFFYCLYTIEG